MRYSLLTISFALMTALASFSQNYHAVNGSPLAGSLGVSNNPASIVNTPHKWDITLFGFQGKSATNAVTVNNYSLLSSGANSEYSFDAGDYSRFMKANFNVNILNARIALSRTRAIAFGMNLRSYTQIKTSPYSFIDTLQGSRQFYDLGNFNRTLGFDAISSSWIELFGTYSVTLMEREFSRLNAGVTVKVTRGISGAFANIHNGRVQVESQPDGVFYRLVAGDTHYAYSANFDTWKDQKTGRQNIKDFLKNTEGGASFDAGLEYLIKSQAPGTVYDEDTYYDYEWKIGISLLDVGINRYKYGVNSRMADGFILDAVDTSVDNKFRNIGGLKNFNDSLATIVQNISSIPGKFTILNPTRLVINVDRPLGNDFYVNGDLSINLSSLAGNRGHVNELNLLTVTPRWETRSLGVYMPVMYNTQGNLWIGAAFKAGPLLIGLHNLGYIFAKNRIQNGGGYLAIVIRAKNKTKPYLDKRLDCPPY